METMETRTINSPFTSPDGRTLEGYAAVWDSPTVIREHGRVFTETIKRGAFGRALASNADIIATFNHNPDRLLGRTRSGTLALAEDDRGLRFTVQLPESAADVRELIQRGDLAGASFTFKPRPGGERWQGASRELTDLMLFEVGPVSQPAYPSTSLGLRSAGWQTTLADYLVKIAERATK